MQKKLIALAIAGLSGAAFAQSNVTIYGVADAGFENVQVSGSNNSANNSPSRFRTTSNSSLIGFKGVEDLGNGLKAVFQMENTISLNNGTDAAGTAPTNSIFGAGGSARDTYVALAGGFGTVAIGTLTGPTRAIGAAVDFNPGATGVGFTGSIYGEILGIKTGSDDRFANAAAYISPDFSGFSFVLGYVPNSNKNNANPGRNDNKYDVGFFYNNGPLYLAYSHIDAKDPAVVTAIVGQAQSAGLADAGTLTVGAFNDELKVDRLAAKYAFPTNTTVSALWDRQKYTFNNGTVTVSDTTVTPAVVLGTITSLDIKRTAWQLAVKQDFGNQAVWLQYAKANKADIGGDVDGTVAKQWTLGYDYAFSKRTMLKAYYSQITNDGNNVTDFYVNGVGGVRQGGDPRALGVGLRHTF